MDPTIVERSPKPASSRRASKRGKHHDIDKDFLRSNLPRQPSGDRDVDFFYMADGTNPATSSSSFSAAAAQPTAPNSYRSTHSTPAPSSYRSSTSSTSKVAANRSFSSSSGATVTTTNTNTKPINKKNSGILRSTATPATTNMDDYYAQRSHGHDIEAAGSDDVVLSVSGQTATTGSSSTVESSKLGVDLSQKQQQQQQQKKMMLEKDPPPQVLFDGDTESAQEEEDYFSMREDIYSLIILSRTCSASFIFFDLCVVHQDRTVLDPCHGYGTEGQHRLMDGRHPYPSRTVCPHPSSCCYAGGSYSCILSVCKRTVR